MDIKIDKNKANSQTVRNIKVSTETKLTLLVSHCYSQKQLCSLLSNTCLYQAYKRIIMKLHSNVKILVAVIFDYVKHFQQDASQSLFDRNRTIASMLAS